MLDIEIMEMMGPAFAAGLLIALTHAPLGLEVLRRGIVFIDLAVAQIAGLEILAMRTIWPEAPEFFAQVAALCCALLAALFFRLVERRRPDVQEAIIGGAFVLAASLAMLLLANHPHSGEELDHLLSGQILFATWPLLVFHAPVYIAILMLWGFLPSARQGLWFYVLFACAITSSVQLAGVYVVFAALIFPAVACALVKRNAVMIAWAFSLASIISGLFISTLSDLPAGPVIVLSYAAGLFLAWLYSFLKRNWRGTEFGN